MSPSSAAEGCPTLETDRLVLRPFVEADLDAYTALLRAEPVRRSLGLADGVGREEAWNQIAAWRGQWALRGTGQWALVERDTGAFVGRAGLHHPERPRWPGIEVGWALHPDHWGRGYATEAGARAVAYAFETFDVDHLASVIAPTNVRSQAVARRLGFSPHETHTFAWWPDPLDVWRLGRDGTRSGAPPARP